MSVGGMRRHFAEAEHRRDRAPRMSASEAIAHFLLWFNSGAYATPEEAAQGLLRRLDHEGYRIVRKQETVP